MKKSDKIAWIFLAVAVPLIVVGLILALGSGERTGDSAAENENGAGEGTNASAKPWVATTDEAFFEFLAKERGIESTAIPSDFDLFSTWWVTERVPCLIEWPQGTETRELQFCFLFNRERFAKPVLIPIVIDTTKENEVEELDQARLPVSIRNVIDASKPNESPLVFVIGDEVKVEPSDFRIAISPKTDNSIQIFGLNNLDFRYLWIPKTSPPLAAEERRQARISAGGVPVRITGEAPVTLKSAGSSNNPLRAEDILELNP